MDMFLFDLDGDGTMDLGVLTKGEAATNEALQDAACAGALVIALQVDPKSAKGGNEVAMEELQLGGIELAEVLGFDGSGSTADGTITGFKSSSQILFFDEADAIAKMGAQFDNLIGFYEIDEDAAVITFPDYYDSIG